MKLQREHIEAIQNFGYTQQEARFLYVVAVHSGYFTQRQYTEFGPKKAGCIASAFTSKLVARGRASEHKYQNNTRVFSLHIQGGLLRDWQGEHPQSPSAHL